MLSRSAVLNSLAPCTVAHQASLFTGFYRQESSASPALALDSFSTARPGKLKNNPEEDKYAPKPITSDHSLLICLSWASPSNKLQSEYLMPSLFNPKSFLFIFTWGGQEYTRIVTPQVFIETFYFIQALNQHLKGLHFSCNLVLAKFVHDLLYSQYKESCKKDSIYSLRALEKEGHKVSKDKP